MSILSAISRRFPSVVLLRRIPLGNSAISRAAAATVVCNYQPYVGKCVTPVRFYKHHKGFVTGSKMPKSERDKSDVIVNNHVKCRRVRIIKSEGVEDGLEVDRAEALQLASNAHADLIQISRPGVEPAICQIGSVSAYKYNLAKKAKAKDQKNKVKPMKIVRLRPGIDIHDLLMKLENVVSFFGKGHIVKVQFQLKNPNQVPLRDALLKVISEGLASVATVKMNKNMTLTLTENSKLRGQKYRLEDKINMNELQHRIAVLNSAKLEDDLQRKTKAFRKPKRAVGALDKDMRATYLGERRAGGSEEDTEFP